MPAHTNWIWYDELLTNKSPATRVRPLSYSGDLISAKLFFSLKPEKKVQFSFDTRKPIIINNMELPSKILNLPDEPTNRAIEREEIDVLKFIDISEDGEKNEFILNYGFDQRPFIDKIRSLGTIPLATLSLGLKISWEKEGDAHVKPARTEYCMWDGHPISAAAKYCPYTGDNIIKDMGKPDMKQCVECGKNIHKESKFCKYNGCRQ